MGGSTFTNVTTQGAATSTAGAGAVSGSTTAPVTRVVELNGEIITTITVDLQNLSASGDVAGTVIGNQEGGEDNDDRAYLLQWSNDTNGVCYKVEMSCIEAPAGNGAASNTAADIDLKLNSSIALNQGAAASGNTLIEAGGDWTSGLTKQQLNASIANNYGVFLVNGATVANTGNAQYSAGKYVIKFYGHVDF